MKMWIWQYVVEKNTAWLFGMYRLQFSMVLNIPVAIFFKVKFESYLLKMLQTMIFDTGKYMEEPVIMGYPIGNLFRIWQQKKYDFQLKTVQKGWTEYSVLNPFFTFFLLDLNILQKIFTECPQRNWSSIRHIWGKLFVIK